MFELDQAMKNWKKSLKHSPIFDDHHVLELEKLILKEIKELIDLGYSTEDAFKQTIARFESVKRWAIKCTGIVIQSEKHVLTRNS